MKFHSICHWLTKPIYDPGDEAIPCNKCLIRIHIESDFFAISPKTRNLKIKFQDDNKKTMAFILKLKSILLLVEPMRGDKAEIEAYSFKRD